MAGSIRDWFDIGKATAPTASIGRAISGVLDLHNKMTQGAGQTYAGTLTPESKARTGLIGAQTDWYNRDKGKEAKVDKMKLSDLNALFEFAGIPKENIPGIVSDLQDPRARADLMKPRSLVGQVADVATLGPTRYEKARPALENPDLMSAVNRFQTQFSGGPAGRGAMDQFTLPQTGSRPSGPMGQGMIAGGAPGMQSPMGGQRSFNTPEEADMSGLPRGTIVMVQGRRYQI